MGGVQGFGPVVVEADEPVFHADWERRVFRMNIAMFLSGHNRGFRYAIERMDPVWYLSSPYYEHWLTAIATGLVEKGVIDKGELDARLDAPFDLASPSRAARVDDPGPSSAQHRFSVGDVVRVREWHPFGHTRAPRYVQGKHGVVVRCDGVFSVPDVAYHSDGTRAEPTYSVRFEAREVWGEAGDPVHVDLWESYLVTPDE